MFRVKVRLRAYSSSPGGHIVGAWAVGNPPFCWDWGQLPNLCLAGLLGLGSWVGRSGPA